jgi:hypothetical protein
MNNKKFIFSNYKVQEWASRAFKVVDKKQAVKDDFTF